MLKKKYAIIKKKLKVSSGKDGNNVVYEMLQYAGKKLLIVSENFYGTDKRYRLEHNSWIWSEWMFKKIVIDDVGITVGDVYYCINLLGHNKIISQKYSNNFLDENNIKTGNCFLYIYKGEEIITNYFRLMNDEQNLLKEKID